MTNEETLGLAAAIVAAYVSNNAVPKDELPGLIASVHTSLHAIVEPAPVVVEPARKDPAVPISKSATPGYMACLECGQKFKSLKRHIFSHHGMLPAEYRSKWGLSKDYPMVCANYSAQRTQIANDHGLGQRVTVAAPADVMEAAE